MTVIDCTCCWPANDNPSMSISPMSMANERSIAAASFARSRDRARLAERPVGDQPEGALGDRGDDLVGDVRGELLGDESRARRERADQGAADRRQPGDRAGEGEDVRQGVEQRTDDGDRDRLRRRRNGQVLGAALARLEVQRLEHQAGGGHERLGGRQHDVGDVDLLGVERCGGRAVVAAVGEVGDDAQPAQRRLAGAHRHARHDVHQAGEVERIELEAETTFGRPDPDRHLVGVDAPLGVLAVLGLLRLGALGLAGGGDRLLGL